MLDPVPRRYTVCSHLFLPRCHRPSPSEEWVGFPRFVPRITTSRISRMQIFLDVPASKFARRIGTFGLAVGAAWAFSLVIAGQVLTFLTRAWLSFAPSTC